MEIGVGFQLAPFLYIPLDEILATLEGAAPLAPVFVLIPIVVVSTVYDPVRHLVATLFQLNQPRNQTDQYRVREKFPEILRKLAPKSYLFPI
jgi:hypothetical protein